MARLKIPFRSVAVEFPAVTGACVTNAPGDGVFPLNPAGVPRGEVGVYRLGILPTNANLQVSWTASSGNVGLTAMRPSGRWRGVVAKGLQPGEFTLTAQFPDGILGMSDPPHIRAAVLEPKVIPLHVYIARDENIPAPLVDGNDVISWVKTVNIIYRQAAMRFALRDEDIKYFTYEQSNNWRDMTTIEMLADLYSFTNVVTGLEIYCVRSLPHGVWGNATFIPPDHLIDDERYGIAIDVSPYNSNPALVLAHEIGHACGSDDILPYSPVSSSTPTKFLLGTQNWTGGDDAVNYLSDGMSYSNTITTLLMHGISTSSSWDIPYGNINGVTNSTDQALQQLPVGLRDMNRMPSH